MCSAVGCIVVCIVCSYCAYCACASGCACTCVVALLVSSELFPLLACLATIILSYLALLLLLVLLLFSLSLKVIFLIYSLCLNQTFLHTRNSVQFLIQPSFMKICRQISYWFIGFFPFDSFWFPSIYFESFHLPVVFIVFVMFLVFVMFVIVIIIVVSFLLIIFRFSSSSSLCQCFFLS